MHGLELGKIHPTAIVSPKADLGPNVTIGAHTIVYDHVQLGPNSVVGPNCILGEPIASFYSGVDYDNNVLQIEADSLIRSGTTIYAGTRLGSHFECGHNVTIREHAVIGDHARIGTLCDIQGFCLVGDYARLHSSVHIGQKSIVGNFVWIFPYTILINDPYPPSNFLIGVTIEDFAVIGSNCVLMPGIRVGSDALVAAMSLVRGDVGPATVVAGNPAKQVTTIYSIRDIRSPHRGRRVYPWRDHFDRGMPWEGIGYELWAKEREAALKELEIASRLEDRDGDSDNK